MLAEEEILAEETATSRHVALSDAVDSIDAEAILDMYVEVAARLPEEVRLALATPSSVAAATLLADPEIVALHG